MGRKRTGRSGCERASSRAWVRNSAILLVSYPSKPFLAAISSRCKVEARAAARSAVATAAGKSPASACAAASVPMSSGWV